MNVLYAILVLGALGAVFGLALALASKVFYVEVDEREERITQALPGANCGGCGFAGCAGCAAAIVSGHAAVSACVPGGEDTARQVADIMGVEAQSSEKMVALVRCSGRGMAEKFAYAGARDCLAATRVPGGSSKLCAQGCLGFGSCVEVCRFGAMSVVDGVARVDRDKCTGCMVCAQTCPQKLIVAVPYAAPVSIPCANTDKGARTRQICESGCIGCGLCAKACPNAAITVLDNVAVVDYAACTGCGACVEKCPRHLIVRHPGNKA